MPKDITKREAGEKLVEYLKEDWSSDDYQFEIAEALKIFGVKYAELVTVTEDADEEDKWKASLWHTYFVLSLGKVVREMPDNNIDDLDEAVHELERERIKAEAKASEEMSPFLRPTTMTT